MTHREIRSRVPLLGPRGRLNPEAAAWGRGAMIDTTGIGGLRHWSRTKRWDYWLVMTPEHCLVLDVSALGYVAFQQVWLYDRATRAAIDTSTVRPFSVGVSMPPAHGREPVRARAGGICIDMEPAGSRTRLRATTPRVVVDLTLERLPVQEAHGVVVPWSPTRFHYSLRDIGWRVRGTIVADGVAHEVGEGAWAMLEHGRGRWPHTVQWQWGVAHGELPDGRRLSFQFAGTWTVGTPSTENAIVLDGRIQKVQEEVVWDFDGGDYLEPWHVYGPRVEARFTPVALRSDEPSAAGVLAGDVNQCFGTWEGHVLLDDGSRLEFDRLEGCAEDAEFRW